MSKSAKYILLAALCPLTACINNDIPYPYVPLSITSVEGEGFTCAETDINTAENTVTLHLDETTNIRQVRINSVGMTEGASSDVSFPGVFDMRADLEVTLSLYQEYPWTIKAEQHISRYFEVESQIGACEIDLDHSVVRVYVPQGTDMNNIRITGLKLGPEGITTMSPAPEEITSFETFRTVDISYHDVKETWYLYVEPTDILANINSATSGTRVMWLSASVVQNESMGFRYRKASDQDWTEVRAEDISMEGATLSAYVGGLSPETEYEVVAYSGEYVSQTVSLTTGSEVSLPNAGFEDWATLTVHNRKNILCPFLSVETAYWGTGNMGASMAGAVLTSNMADPRPGSQGKYAAVLQSKYPSMIGIGKFAAGNLFTGDYLDTDIGTMSGVVAFGRPFTQRPTALHGWLKYTMGTIEYVSDVKPAGVSLNIGDPDSGVIYIALGNWTKEEFGYDAKGILQGTDEMPVIVDTRDVNSFFNKNSDAVIGYGELILEETVSSWQEFTVNVEYRRFDVQPTHIIIVCTSSRYGDYFTGGTGSELRVDDFSLIYDKVD